MAKNRLLADMTPLIRNCDISTQKIKRRLFSPSTLVCYCLIAFAGLLLCPRESRACMCSNLDEGSTLSSFENSNLVVVARIVSLGETEKTSGAPVERTAVMVVEKAYKGDLAPGENMEVALGDYSCGYGIGSDIDSRHLLYLNNPQSESARYRVDPCSRSREVTSYVQVIADIHYFENLAHVQEKTGIFGRLESNSLGSNPDFGGRKVRVRRQDDVWELVTDQHGFYEIYDLPEGEYVIEPEIPDNWEIVLYGSRINIFSSMTGKSRVRGRQVVLKAGRHVEENFSYRPDSAIRGRLLSSTGNPLKGFCLSVSDLEDSRTNSICSNDEDGEFEIEGIPEGTYMLDATKDISAPPLFYYPGVADKENAKIFSITPGVAYNDLIFKIPESEDSESDNGEIPK
jgi:hypothetical protein